jgi:hypothetical protein
MHHSELNVAASEVILRICSDYIHACVKLPVCQQLSNNAQILNTETQDKEWMFYTYTVKWEVLLTPSATNYIVSGVTISILACIQ